MNIGLQLSDYYFATYLTKQGYTPQSVISLEEVRTEYNKKSKVSQRWLEENYPHKKVSEIYLNQQLEGELDLESFTHEHTFLGGYKASIKVYVSSQVDENKLVITSKKSE